jgi:glycosyltransferase involved in cell wall biosynthesis
MPACNARPYLDDSLGSIVGQTFEDFELVVLDDGSTDGSADTLCAWARRDARIRLYRSDHRLGPTRSANFVVEQARAALVARMDADDVSHPHRLRRQIDVMEARPDAALVGTLSDGMDEAGRPVRPRDRWRLLRSSSFVPFPHGSVMFRRRLFEAAGGYREACEGWQEQDLFLRMSEHGRILVLPDTLYRYRYRAASVTMSRSVEEAVRVEGMRRRYFAERHAGGNCARPSRGGGDVSPAAARAALRSAGAMQLWAGYRPRLLRPMLGRDVLEWSASALGAVVWAAWASASPGSLRCVLRSVIRARDLLAGLRLRDGEAYEWRFA